MLTGEGLQLREEGGLPGGDAAQVGVAGEEGISEEGVGLLGLLLLLPPVRSLLYGEITVMIRTSFKTTAQAEMRREEETQDSTIIEADYRVVGQTDADPKPPPHDRDPPTYGGGGGSSGGASRPSIRLLL